jgi:hypothetical protein
MTMDARCKIHHVDERCCFATRDDVTVSVWRGIPTMDRIVAQRSVLERTLRLYDKVYSLTAIRASDMSMGQFSDDKMRVEFEKLSKLMDGSLVAHALVILGTGFIAATLRSVTVSLGMIMRSRVAGKSFDDVFAGSKWLVTQREGGPRAGEHDALDGLLRTVNAQLDSYATSSAAAR